MRPNSSHGRSGLPWVNRVVFLDQDATSAYPPTPTVKARVRAPLYGIKSFLISQSLNQIEKAYGTNNSILDNCPVRVCFATNDDRTAKRVSDSLGVATQHRAMKNYAGYRLSPWLGQLWLFIVAPLIGGVAAGVVARALHPREP
jgi:hypothetical protein